MATDGVDRGGLNYRISLDAVDSLAAAKEVKLALLGVSTEFTDLKAVLATSLGGAASLRELVNALAALKKAQEEAAERARLGAQADNIEGAAKTRLAAILRNKRVEEELQVQAAQASIEVTLANNRALTIEEAALRKNANALRAKLVAEEQVRQGGEAAIAAEERRERAADRRARAEERLARAEALRARGEPLSRVDSQDIARDLANLENQRRAVDIHAEAVAKNARALQARLVAQEADRIEGEKAVIAAEKLAIAENAVFDARARAAALGARGEPLSRVSNPAIAENLARIEDSRRATKDLTTETDKGSTSFAAYAFRVLAVSVALRAAFSIARAITTAIKDLASGSVEFGAGLERAQQGTAAVLAAVTQVRDSQGNLVTGARAFALAQGEAKKQTQQLRQDALLTTASFEELAKTFEVALGPGLRAGLDVNQVRQFTISIAQAASAIGVKENQLVEEIRSILSGTVSVRNTRIAVALGITNNDIKRARETGTLAQFLASKFDSFKVAASASLGTFDSLLSRVSASFRALIGTGGVVFFDQIKKLLGDLLSLTTTTNDEGFLQPSPKALAVIQAIDAGLADVVFEARRLVGALDLGNLQQTMIAVSTLVGNVVRVLGGFFEGLTRGIGDLSRVFNVVAALVDKISGGVFDQGNLQSSISAFTELAVVVAGLRLAFTGISAAVTLIGSGIAVVGAPVAILIGTVGIGAVLFKSWLDSMAGVDLRFGSIRDILNAGLFRAFEAIPLLFKKASLEASIFALQITGGFSSTSKEIKFFEDEINKVNNKLIATTANTIIDVRKIIAENATAENTGQFLDRTIGNVKDKLLELFTLIPGFSSLLQTQVKDGLQKAGDIAEEATFTGRKTPSILEQIFFGPDGETGVKAFIEHAADLVTAATQTIQSGFNQFTSFISDAILDAFDPNKKTGLKERFAQFLQGLSKLVLDFVVKLLVAKAILQAIAAVGGAAFGAGAAEASQATASAASAGGSSLGGLTSSGFARGGYVSQRGSASRAHHARGVQHFDVGGRPRGLPSSDTVPAWLTPGEWVMRLSAVKRYGVAALSAINEGVVDPSALAAVTGRGRSGSVAAGGPGYAGGGLVADRAANNPHGRQSNTTVLPVIAANDQNMERLINGGRSAFLRFMGENATDVNQALGGRR